jgi:hypothetical protein
MMPIPPLLHIHILYIHPSSFAEIPLRLLIAGQLGGKNLPGVPSRDSNSGLPFQQADVLQTELRLTLEGIGWVGIEEAILDVVQGTRIRINQVSASSCCDYIPPVSAVQGRDTSVSDTSSKGRIVQGTHRPRDESSKGCIVQELSFASHRWGTNIVMASERRKEVFVGCTLSTVYYIKKPVSCLNCLYDLCAIYG